MFLLVLIGLGFALVMFPTFRCAFFHPVLLVVNGVRDLIQYIRYKEYNLYGTGELVAYTGLFGKGKTLSVVHRVVTAYERAFVFAQEMREKSIGVLFCGVLHNYLRYVDDPGCDSNRWRWPMKKYWSDLLNGAEKIRLYKKPGVEYNMINLEDFVIGQAGNAVAAYIEIMGQNAFMDALRKRGKQMPVKYRQLIDQYKKKP